MNTRKQKSIGGLTKGTGKPQYLYRQLSQLLAADIKAGLYKPGDALPSMDDLADKYHINKATVIQAVADLAASGLVYSIPAKGTYVAEPNQPAASRPARNAKSLTIGWISTILTSDGKTGRYHTEMMDAVRMATQEIGGTLTVISAAGLSLPVFSKMVGDAGLDAAVLIGPARSEEMRRALALNIPSVMIDDVVRGRRVDSILLDNEGGGYQAVEHLVGLGHRRLAFITCPLAWKVCQDRMAGAHAAMIEAGLSPSDVVVVESDFTSAGGYEAMKKALAHRPLPTGYFLFNDEMAFGAFQAVHEHSNLRIPEDISLVGFDDIVWAAMTVPPLTTVHVEKALMGREAVLRIRKIMDDRNHVPLTTVLPTRLEIRKSAGPAPSLPET